MSYLGADAFKGFCWRFFIAEKFHSILISRLCSPVLEVIVLHDMLKYVCVFELVVCIIEI